MSSLVKRLRNPPCGEQWTHGGLFDEAADEIERLTAEREALRIKYVNSCDARDALQARVETLEVRLAALADVTGIYMKYGTNGAEVCAQIDAATEQGESDE